MNFVLSGCSLQIGERLILDQVSLDLQGGDVYALLGPNGSGKTSLLRAIAGLIPRKAQFSVQEILLGEQNITSLPIDERAQVGVGLAWQEVPILRGVKLDRLFDLFAVDPGFAQFFDLEERQNDNRALSGGQKRLFELAMVLAGQPRLLLLDEVDSGLDIDNLKLIGRWLQNYLAEHPETICIVVSHTWALFDFIPPTRAGVLRVGQIIEKTDLTGLRNQICQQGYREL